MKRKQKFLSAVKILAPGDALILRLARRVSEEELPAFPGAAALQFVAQLSRLTPNSRLCARRRWLSPCLQPVREPSPILTIQC